MTLALLAASSRRCSAALSRTPFAFANTLGDGMVLQRDSPLALWGHGDCGGGCTVALEQGPACTSPVCDAAEEVMGGHPAGVWQMTLPPMPASGSDWMPSTPFNISLYLGAKATGTPLATLHDVLVGDVVLVSGQSNVGISVTYSNQDNATAQEENKAEANRIGSRVRIMSVHGSQERTEQQELSQQVPCKLPSAQCACLPWSRANGTNVVGYSALGWYIARELFAAQDENVPIGIIQSDVPGTPIQKWMPNAILSECYSGARNNTTMAGDSELYNGMIHPFVAAKQAVSAVVWYQGESNVGPNSHVEIDGSPDPHGPENGASYYACALPAMVNEWRNRLPSRSYYRPGCNSSSPDCNSTLPFFVVELAAYCNEQDESTFRTFCDANHSKLTAADYHLPEMRLAQAAVLDGDAHAYLGSAMDLGSLHPLPYESIHPTNKQEVARRLALAMRSAMYGEKTVFVGPRPTSASMVEGKVAVQFELQDGAGGLALDTAAACPEVVLDVYCRRAQMAGFEVEVGGKWAAPKAVALASTKQAVVLTIEGTDESEAAAAATRVRYAYSDWPVVSLRNENGGLPARIFDIEVAHGSSVSALPPVFEIATDTAVAHVDRRFLSVTLDGHTFDEGSAMPFWKPGSKLTRTLAGALQPAYIRFGGGSHSRLSYNMTSQPLPVLPPLPAPAYQPPVPTTVMSVAQWTAINEFCAAVGWTNVFALNALLRVADTGGGSRFDSGDSSAAAQLLRHTYAQKWAPVVWELANEPDLFHYAYNISDHSVFPVPAKQLVQDHVALRALIAELSPGTVKQQMIVGPDVANAGSSGGKKYWMEYFGNQTARVKPPSRGVDAASWHHYYGSSKTATLADTHSPKVLDSFITEQTAMAKALAERTGCWPSDRQCAPIWLGETSSFYGGGAANVSNRYGAGFTWLDKLGAAARLNVSVVCRQAWMGGEYSLIQYSSFRPLPDYWASVLHKRLMGTAVLDVQGSLLPGRSLRVWASCTHAAARKAAAGAVTLLVLNTNATEASVQPVNAAGDDMLSGGWDEYLLTPADQTAGLSSAQVALNGEELSMVDPHGDTPSLPPLPPATKTGAKISIPGLSFGFFVLHGAKAAACKHDDAEAAVVSTGLTSLIPFPSRANATLRIGYTAAYGTKLAVHCSIQAWPASVGSAAIWQKDMSLPAGSGDVSVVVTPAVAPDAWDLQHPMLYTVNCSTTTLHNDVLQRPPPSPPAPTLSLSVRFGFRSFAVDAGRFMLNGRPIFIRGNSINPPGRDLPSVSGTKQFALDYMRYLKKHAHVNAMRIGDGVSSSTAPWYSAADEVGMLIYAGPYSNVACPGCRAKPADSPVPAGSVEKAVADYENVIRGVAPHPSHVILILSNENDISGPHGHVSRRAERPAYPIRCVISNSTS